MAVPYLGTSKGKGFLSFDCVFPGHPDISICVAEVAERTHTIFIEEFTKVFWGKILRGFEICNLLLCVYQLLYGFPPQTFKHKLDSSIKAPICNDPSCPILKLLQKLNFYSITATPN